MQYKALFCRKTSPFFKVLKSIKVKTFYFQIHVTDPKHSWEKTFNFDHVFPKEATNPEVLWFKF